MSNLRKMLPKTVSLEKMVPIQFRLEPAYKKKFNEIAEYNDLTGADTFRALILKAHQDIKR